MTIKDRKNDGLADRSRTSFAVHLCSPKSWCLILSGFLSLAALSSCRSVQSVIHPDHGRRRIAFPAASGLVGPRVSGSSVTAGTTGGYGVLRFDIRDPKTPKFMRGIPYCGEITGKPAFLAYYGYFPVKEGLLVVGVLTDIQDFDILTESLEFFEFIPFRGTPRVIRISEPRRELFVLADDGLRTFDISLPSRPVLSGFDPSVRSGPQDTMGATVLICPMPEGGIARLEGSDPRQVILPDGKKRPFQENVKDIFEKEGKILVLTESDRLLDENGNEILKQAGMFSLEKGVSSWISCENGSGYFHRESAGNKSDWKLPDLLKDCRAFHADGSLFAAIHDHAFHFGVLNDKNKTADIKSSVPVIDLKGPITLKDSMAYGVSGSDGRHFLLYGMDFRLPPRDGTPYDLLFPYTIPENEEKYVPATDSVLAAGDFLFVPGALFRLSWSGPELIRTLGTPASAVRLDETGHRVVMTYAKREKGTYPGAVVYDISELPALRKISETEEPSGFIDAIAEGENLWLLSPEGRIVCCSMTTGKKISEIPAPPGNARTVRFIRNDSLLHVFPAPGDPAKIWRVVDIRDPGKPFVRNEIEGLLPDGVSDAALSGSSLFVSSGTKIIRFDISDPEKPVWKENFRGKEFSRSDYTGLKVRGKILIGRKQGFLDVWDDWTKGDDHDDDI